MNHRFIIALLVLTGLLMTGCASREPIILTVKPQTPDWLMTPPLNSDDLFYGVGEGNSAQASEQAALAHLTERLMVQISSSQEQRLTSSSDSREYVEREVLSMIQSKTERLPLGGYQIIKQDLIAPQRTATLLALNKSELIDNLSNEISNSLNISSEEPIETLYNWTRARQQLAKLIAQKPLITLLEQLGESDIASKYSRQLTEADRKIKDYLSANPVSIQTSMDCERFQGALERLILQAGFQITPSSGALTTVCQVDEEVSLAYGIHIAKADLSLRFIGEQSNVEHTTTLFIKSASSASETAAKAGLINALYQRIQSNDSMELLGF